MLYRFLYIGGVEAACEDKVVPRCQICSEGPIGCLARAAVFERVVSVHEEL